MTARIPERHKIPGVSYAVTEDGTEWPVVDITHPAFRLEPSPAELARLVEKDLPRIKKSARTPRFLLWLLARRSIIVRETVAARGSFVSGMTTYLLKIGPDNLGRGYAGRIDRHIASSLSPVCIRLRLRDTARLLAEGLTLVLKARRGPLHLLNIGGGTAIDSLNAVILLAKQHPDLLAGRRILVQVLDIDKTAPHFGAGALAALREAGAPLYGLDAGFEHAEHDWSDMDGLRRRLLAVDRQAVLAVSSEGGLFEYGSDDLIAGNLAVLRDGTPADCVLVGSLMKDEPAPRLITENGKAANRLFAEEAFESLVRRAGWTIDRRAGGNPVYEVVRLAKPH